MTDICAASGQTRRRIFWTTQPAPCGTDVECGTECGRPGLRYMFPSDPDNRCGPPGCADHTIRPECIGDTRTDYLINGLTIDTSDWLRGIIINMLMTDGKVPNSACGYLPGAQGGHWSESFREDSLPVGTLMRSVTPTGSIREQVQLVAAYAQATVQRLLDLGVVSRIAAAGKYLGGNRMLLEIEYTAPTGITGRVGISTTRLENSWVFA
ncbi:putative structural protein [Synechococcus phage Ssp-JY38]|nr:hypothetical protein [Synechococcus phage Yong-L2-223]